MVKLTEETRSLIGNIRVAMVATASKDGKPNISPKGSFRVVDDDHVAFGDIHSPRTIANLKENPQLSAILFDPSTRKGCRIWGKANVLNSGELFNAMSAEYAARKTKVEHVVLVAIDEILLF